MASVIIAIGFDDDEGDDRKKQRESGPKARISPKVPVKEILPNIITKMQLPVTAPDGTPMSYRLDHKESGRRLDPEKTLPEQDVKEGDHLIVCPEIVAGEK